MRKQILLEIAVASLERAIAAERAGAHRLELCSSLELGGLTPSLELLRQVRAAVKIPIHMLVRPRAGNFFYTAEEFAQMKSAIRRVQGENIQGIVAGALLPEGSIDIARTGELVALASPMSVTFHRAFDETSDSSRALEDVIGAGASRVLTSGGMPSAAGAIEILRKLITQAAERITILPGGGLHAGNIAAVAQIPGIRELHTGLGTVLPYSDPHLAKFESAIRKILAAL